MIAKHVMLALQVVYEEHVVSCGTYSLEIYIRTKARKERVEALRRKLSNVAAPEGPIPEVPGTLIAFHMYIYICMCDLCLLV